MKKMVIGLFIAVALPLAVGCGSVTPDSPEEGDNELKTIVLTKGQEAVANTVAEFGIDLFRDVAIGENGNMMISPFSASLCLSMLAAGAQGETYSQMAKALGFEGLSSEDIGSYYKTIVDGVLSADNSSVISVADAIWIAKNMTLRKPYVSEVTAYYNAVVDNLDFNNPQAAAGTINARADRNTNGMIKHVVDDLDPATRMVLANALYFKGKWRGSHEFALSDRKFTDITGKSDKVKFFGEYGSRQMWGYVDGVRVLGLPYGNGAFRMVMVLPPAGIDFKQFISGIKASDWNKWVESLRSCDVNFQVPVFKSEFTMEDSFKEAMEKRGMKLAFTPYADFGKISNEDICINFMIQKTAVDVNEKGTEAAAVTVVGMKTTSVSVPEPPKEFIADRPFIYAITETTSKTLLFIGTHVK